MGGDLPDGAFEALAAIESMVDTSDDDLHTGFGGYHSEFARYPDLLALAPGSHLIVLLRRRGAGSVEGGRELAGAEETCDPGAGFTERIKRHVLHRLAGGQWIALVETSPGHWSPLPRNRWSATADADALDEIDWARSRISIAGTSYALRFAGAADMQDLDDGTPIPPVMQMSREKLGQRGCVQKLDELLQAEPATLGEPLAAVARKIHVALGSPVRPEVDTVRRYIQDEFRARQPKKKRIIQARKQKRHERTKR